MATPFDATKPRRNEALLRQLVQDEAVIAIHGPRSVGKSTLLRKFAGVARVEVIDLDDPAIREAVAASPSIATSGHRPVCIDEYQYVPEVLDALKARLNREGVAPGTAVLTGSTRQDALPRAAQALTGRLHSVSLWPLSQGEIDGTTEDLLPSLRAAPDKAVAALPSSSTQRSEYVDRICAGGFPLAQERSETARNRWFDDYVKTSIDRDAQELIRIGQRQLLGDLLGRLSAQTGQVLNVSGLAQSMGAERRTLNGYIRLLEDLFLVSRLPAWGKTLHARVTHTPKIHIVDSGVAARLLRIGPQKLNSLDPTVLTEFGHLIESFAVGELRKQVSWLDESVTMGHWRTSDGDEVDLVLEFDDGSVLAFEVKAAERVAGSDFRGLRKLRDALGDRFIAGVALSTGPRSYTYEERLHVLPLDRLWRMCGI